MDVTTLIKRLCSLAAILFGGLAAPSFAQDVPKDPREEWRALIITELSGNDCKPTENAADRGGRICKGAEGYSLLVTGDDRSPEIYLIAANGRRYPLRYWNTHDPYYKGLRYFATWVVVRTSPKSIGLLFGVETAAKQDYSFFGSYDVIARVAPNPVCIVGSVAASSTSAGDGIGIATSPSRRRCLRLNEREKRDWFRTAERLAGEGKINAARLALKNVSTPSERFIVYREIAKAQFHGGDVAAARRTLLTARAEALRNPLRDDLVYTLIQVVAGMADAGFHEDARSDIKLFRPSDRLRMYLMVASIQAEQKNLDAARTTFQAAILSEGKTGARADWNLSEIGSEQVRIGLLDDARKTAGMIQDPSARDAVERRIRERPAGP